jgi:hypothetical protein
VTGLDAAFYAALASLAGAVSFVVIGTIRVIAEESRGVGAAAPTVTAPVDHCEGPDCGWCAIGMCDGDTTASLTADPAVSHPEATYTSHRSDSRFSEFVGFFR